MQEPRTLHERHVREPVLLLLAFCHHRRCAVQRRHHGALVGRPDFL